MNTEIGFTKNGIAFKLKVSVITFSGVKFSWRAMGKGVTNVKSGDNYFAYLDPTKKVVKFSNLFKLNGKLVAGVLPDEETYTKLLDLQKNLMLERDKYISDLVNSVLDGKVKASCGYTKARLDGYEYPEKCVNWDYEDKTKLDYYGIAFSDILDKAVMSLGVDIPWKRIVEGLLMYVKPDDCKAGRKVTILELLETEIQKIARDQKRHKDILDKAKITGKQQELCRWVTNCHDPNEDCSLDIVIEYIMPDGSHKQDIIHTY